MRKKKNMWRKKILEYILYHLYHQCIGDRVKNTLLPECLTKHFFNDLDHGHDRSPKLNCFLSNPFQFFLNEKLKILTQCSYTLRRDCSLDIQLYIHYHPFHPPQNSILCYMLVRWPFPHHYIFVFTIEVCLACCQLVHGSNFIVHSEKTLRLTGVHLPPSDYDYE